MWRSVFIVITIFISISAWGSVYRLSLPLVYGETQLGDLPVEINGMSLVGVSISGLNSVLVERITAKWWQENIPKNGSDYVTVETLNAKGVSISLNPELLVLQATLDSEILNETDINLSSGYPLFKPSESGYVSWLNSFNLTYNHYWEDDSESWNSSLDWLSQANIGGAEGVNFLLANYLEATDESTEFYRGEWVAFHDRPNVPVRFSAGDVVSGESGHLYSLSLGGISIESRYSDLQPDREISPQSSQQLVLLESAEVELYVNGERVSGGRLDPGRYNLQNLILDNGANDITVVVNYVSGKQEVLQFTQFYNATLLAKGLIDYSFSFGRPIEYGDRAVGYEDAWVGTGYIEYGLTDWLTIGSNGLGADDGAVLGVLSTVKTPIGNVTGRYSWSGGSDFGDGWIASLDYENSVIGSGDSQAPNLRLAIERSDNFNSKPWGESEPDSDHTQILASYFWQITSELDLSLSGRYGETEEDSSEKRGTGLFNWRRGGITIGVGSEYEESSQYEDGDTRFLFTFEYNWYSTDSSNRLGLSYNSKDERSRAYFSNEANNYVGDVGVRVDAERDQDIDNQQAQMSYTASRLRTEVEVSRNKLRSSDDEQYQGSVRLATAVGMVDGQWGWGRVTSGPFVLANVHSSLEGGTANLDVNSEGKATANATSQFNGIVSVSQPFVRNAMDYNVEDAPLGYDWGNGKIEVSPGSATGHILNIGSDAFYTAIGFIEDGDGEPLAYVQGRMILEELDVAFFTNKQGRFYIQGVRPGTYRMEISQSGIPAISVTIPASKESLINLGKLSVLAK